MSGQANLGQPSVSEVGQLREDNKGLRRQVARLQDRLAATQEDTRIANAAKDALVTRLQFELSDVERGVADLESRIVQLLEENDRLRTAIVDAASR